MVDRGITARLHTTSGLAAFSGIAAGIGHLEWDRTVAEASRAPGRQQ